MTGRLWAALVIAAALLAAAAAPDVARADACTPPVTNPIACENTKPGVPPEQWEIGKAGDDTLQGFAARMSVNRGETVNFKIKSTTAGAYHVDILRLGYYGGNGARMMAQNLAPTGTSTQPACQTQASTGLVDCGNWSTSLSWTVPSTAVSGVYIAHLVRNSDPEVESHIVFVVRDDASTSPIVYQTSDSTWQAYNRYGGSSLYTCDAVCPEGNPTTYKAAYKVSYNRPNNSEQDSPPSSLFGGAEYSMIRFLEASGYNVSYLSGVDTHASGSLLRNHRLFLSSGHDEYWSATQRANMEAARDAGVNLTFFSGNTGFWKTRYEPSLAGPATANRTLVSYKDTHFPEQQDPVEWTGTWRDNRFGAGLIPENALIGTSFVVNSGTSNIKVPYAYRQQRLWRNTAATSLPVNGSLDLAPNTLGYEWDVDADNGFRPAGLFRMSSTTVSGVEVFTDHGSHTKFGGTATHNLTMYRAPSGARVFSSGSVQWAFGLDDFHQDSTIDRNMRQATLNLFADMGVQPYALLPGLAAASPSTDNTRPSSTIDALPASVPSGSQVTIRGTASDAGGGVVGGVEVSTDGGASWHPATSGTTSWSYTWTARGNPSTTIRSRAVDDSGNLEVPGTGRSVNVSCPCSIWGPTHTVPAEDADGDDPSPIEVGVKFKSDKYGTVSGIRFYKSALNTGTHIGSLWSASGERLAQATFSGETASGWQTVTFNSPVEVQPDTTYVASYYAPNGHYSATAEYFYDSPAPGPNGGAVLDSAPLHAIRNAGTATNGVYNYGGTSSFPVNTFGAGNYWVDVIFSPTAAPGLVTGVTAVSGGPTSANVSWTAPAGGGAPTSYRVTPYVGATAQTPRTVTGSPPATTTTVSGLTTGTTYTFRVEAVNPNGSGGLSAPSNAVTPQGAVVPAAPTAVSAEGASQSARVSWTAPGSDGGSALTGYTITPYIGSTAQAPVQAAASATSVTIPGLTNGTAYTFRVTARNDIGSSPASSASNATTPHATIFDFAAPATADSGDTSSVELGVKFKADSTGTVTGVRFYKSSANTGTHTGSLWTTGGTRLAQATFTNETASGWQSVTFATPVPVTAGTTYVASYFAPFGRYAGTGGGLSSGADNGPLHAIANSTSANGVYAYGTSSAFPTSTYNAANYWVDVMYAVPAPGQATSVTAAVAGATSATVSWSPPASGGPVTSYRVTPYIGSTAQTSKTVTGSPLPTTTTVSGLTSGTTYTFRVQAVNANGAGALSTPSNEVTPQAAVVPSAPSGVAAQPASGSARITWTAAQSDGDSPITGQTVTPYIGAAAQTPLEVSASATSATVTGLTNGETYTFRVKATNAVGSGPSSPASNEATPQSTIFDFSTPAVVDSGDGSSAELGVKFRSETAGAITGIRYYKASLNTGAHIGSLWTADGTRLAQATFSDETDSGWQSVRFATPVAIAADTTYVASYFAPRGHYSVTSQGLADGVVNAPLRALADSASANGVYTYGSSSTFPSSTHRAGNYWVDVLYKPAAAPAGVTDVSATAGEASASVSWTAPSSGGPVARYTITPYIGSVAQTPKAITGSPPATSTTVSGLTAGTAYTFTVRASNPGGAGPESSPSNPVTPTGAVAPGAPTNVAVEADSTSAVVTWTPPTSDGGSDITGYTVTPYTGSTAGTDVTVGASTTRTRVTGLTNGTSYTFRVRAANAAGSGAQSTASSEVVPRSSIFELATPAIIDSGDTDPVVLGLKFRADVAGTVTGVRFYKSAANTGTHVGSLWSETGELLRESSFSGESASGWQTVRFATPAAITAGATYVVSYLAPNGRYSLTGGAFGSTAFVNPPLRALDNDTSRNGVFRYGGTSAFPTGSFNSANYWVDVLFAPAA